MNLSALDLALWVAGFVGYAALFTILVVRRRWRQFPVFTTVVCFETVMNPVLYAFFRLGYSGMYVRTYWFTVIFDFAFQLGVVFEIARIVLKPTGTWVQDAKKQFFLWGTTGILLAAALPWLVSPPSAGLLDRLEVRGNLFTSLVICELIAVVTRTSRSLGLGWRNHVMALGNGWTVWAVVAILVSGLHSYFGAQLYFRELEHVRMLVYLGVVGYWMIQFWLEEPVRQPISPELRAYIEALHRQVKKDLDTLGAQG
jgi:hypothetical protein